VFRRSNHNDAYLGDAFVGSATMASWTFSVAGKSDRTHKRANAFAAYSVSQPSNRWEESAPSARTSRCCGG